MREHIVELLPFLKAFARTRSFNRSDAEDLVNDTICKALQYEASFDGRNPKAWLFTIMRNLRLSQLRHGRVVTFQTLNDPENEKAFDVPVPGTQQPSVELADTLTAMKTLRLEEIDILILLARGHSYEQIAAEFCVACGTIKSRAARGRHKLKELA